MAIKHIKNPPKNHPIFKLGGVVGSGAGWDGWELYKRAMMRQKLKKEALETGRSFELVEAEFLVFNGVPKRYDWINIDEIRSVGIECWPHWETVLAGIGDLIYRRQFAAILSRHSAVLEQLRRNPPAPPTESEAAAGTANAPEKIENDPNAEQQAGETGKSSE